MPEQLILNLPVRESHARGDFFVSETNALAVAQLDAIDAWPDHRLILVGPEGAGKSHLAHVWAEAHSATILTGAPQSANATATARANALVLEDVDDAPIAEERLFHLMNAARSSRTPLLMTARQAPYFWRLKLADLKSRVAATTTATIASPDDALLSALLVKLFSDRQIEVDPKVVDYALPRIERSFAAVRDLVRAVDRLSLAEKRAITVPVLRKVLDG